MFPSPQGSRKENYKRHCENKEVSLSCATEVTEGLYISCDLSDGILVLFIIFSDMTISL